MKTRKNHLHVNDVFPNISVYLLAGGLLIALNVLQFYGIEYWQHNQLTEERCDLCGVKLSLTEQFLLLLFHFRRPKVPIGV